MRSPTVPAGPSTGNRPLANAAPPCTLIIASTTAGSGGMADFVGVAFMPLGYAVAQWSGQRSSDQSVGVVQWPGRELNPRHADFQSAALPTELPGRWGGNIERGQGRGQAN